MLRLLDKERGRIALGDLGEIRDPDTAEIATQAALTGHLVLSTLHTNDACGALTRLLDLGVAPYLVASTVEAVLAQRLVRRLCARCVGRVAPSEVVTRELALGSETNTVPAAVGCPECRGTGYRGRLGIYELLMLDDGLRSEVSRGLGATELRRVAVERGMRTLRYDGARLVRDGLTTPDEVLRVTSV